MINAHCTSESSEHAVVSRMVRRQHRCLVAGCSPNLQLMAEARRVHVQELSDVVHEVISRAGSSAAATYEFYLRLVTASERPPSFVLLDVGPAEGAAARHGLS